MSITVRRIAALLIVASTVLSTPSLAQDYRPTFNPADFKGPPTGSANQVLVLGTPHLSDLPETFQPDQLEPLLVRLAAWAPTAIAIEAIPGLQCDRMRRQPERFASSLGYCFDPRSAGEALGLDVSTASREADQLLKEFSVDPTPGQRRRLAALFLAAGEPVSATVQWLRLPSDERRAGDGVTPDMAAALDRRTMSRNENELIAAALAARLGLERVWSVDDQSTDIDVGDRRAYGAAVMASWDNPATTQRRAADAELNAGLGRPDGLLNLYRALNAAAQAELNYNSDWGAALTEPSPEAYGRRYVAYWETRNLRMVANLREVTGRQPGGRFLAIVGASHKPYYEAYLEMMHDVILVDPGSVLR